MNKSFFEVGSAQALLAMAGSGAVFIGKDVVFGTSDTRFQRNVVAEVVVSNSRGIFVEVFRMDIEDSPETINVDRYQISSTRSPLYITKLRFQGPGHHRFDLPSSLSSLPIIIC
jgi:hypothetical protein